jgi:heptosyltransferase II
MASTPTNVADRVPRRLAVRMPNWLGDAVMALPAAGAVRAAFPDAHLAVVALPSIAPVFEEQTPARPQQILAVDKQSETEALRAGQFDTVLLLTNSFGTAWTAHRAGVRERWGYSASLRGPLLTAAVRRPAREVHQTEYYLELVRQLGLPAPAIAPRIDVTSSTVERARRVFEQHGVRHDEGLVGFAPGAAYGHAKRWPPRRVADVIARLVKEQGIRCVLVGATADRASGREIESSLPPGAGVVNLIGRTDLRQLIGVLRACRAFVSNDSGAMHLAAAIGIPVTALFGPTKAHVTAPVGDHDVLRHDVFCSPCMLRECPIDHRCMKRITSDEVFASVAQRISTRA